MEDTQPDKYTPIAIVGSACRFPGSANSPESLWTLLESPSDVLRDFSSDRLNFSNFYSRNSHQPGRTNVEGKSYLLEDDCGAFDARFFRIHPREARSMDPQHRMVLELVYEALEAAGWSLDKVEGSFTGVFVGCMGSDYHDIQVRDPDTLTTYTATGTARSMISNRVSYFFDLKGPSMTIDTACSSSLVALHQAIRSLQNNDASQAIVAGTSLLLDSSMYIAESKLQMLSPDSRSRMWDGAANGYARGEGTAAIILKSLERAILDNDHIECIIKGIGINSDGRTDGLTMPSSTAQLQLIRATYQRAGLDPVADRCQYFECHGTGTPAGDPVEARAIKEAFFPDDVKIDGDVLYCGSIKTIIGHLEGCAGLAGVLKASLVLQHRKIPPNMHFKDLNEAIKPYYSHLEVPVSLIPWPQPEKGPLRASVNSFGFGGTNAHVILENYQSEPEVVSREAYEMSIIPSFGPFVFSAKSQSALLRVLKSMLQYVRNTEYLNMADLSWILSSRRTVFPIRVSVAASSRTQLLAALEHGIRMTETPRDMLDAPALPIGATHRDRILGVFTGQGAQWATMGRRLVQSSPIFRQSLERCEDALRTLPNPPEWSLLEELLSEGSKSRVSQGEFAQPLCTALQISLVDILDFAGVRFAAVIGHSSGEIAASYAAGRLGLRDAMGLAYYRGIVSQKCSSVKSGAMMAVGMAYQSAIEFCSQPRWVSRVVVAANNAPSNITLSGDFDAIQEAKDVLNKDRVFTKLLQVDTGYHSPHMLAVAEEYADYLDQMKISVQPPRGDCVWYSTVLESSSPSNLEGQYWVDNLVNPVLFYPAMLSAIGPKNRVAMILEVGPHSALQAPVAQIVRATNNGISLPYASCLDRRVHEVESLASAVGTVWSHFGARYVDLEGWRRCFLPSYKPKMLINLPSYPWDHDEVFWHESRISHNYRLSNQVSSELLGRLCEDTGHEMTWRNILSRGSFTWLEGHVFQGQVVFPGAGYASMCMEAAKAFLRGRTMKVVEIKDMNIRKALVFADYDDHVEVLFYFRSRTLADNLPEGHILEAEFSCHTCSDELKMEKNCDGTLLIHLGSPMHGDLPTAHESQANLPRLDVNKFYAGMAGLGITYSGPFRALNSVHRIWGSSRAFASWDEEHLDNSYILHPAVLDMAFQVGFATTFSLAEGAMGNPRLPFLIRRLIIDPSANCISARDACLGIDARLVNIDRTYLEVDSTIRDPSTGALVIRVDGLILKSIAEPSPRDDRLLFTKTVWEVDAACGLPTSAVRETSKHELDLVDIIERTALFYLQTLLQSIQPGEANSFKWHHQAFLRGVDFLMVPVREGRHDVLRAEWLSDIKDTIHSLKSRYPESVDLAFLTAVGENLVSVVRGESEILEHMLADNLLDRLYSEGRGFATCNEHVASLIRPITFKHPRLRILEIGAGTGGTTRSILNAIGNAYATYVYTDISSGFFERAAEKLADHVNSMEFKTLNIEEPPIDQGFFENSFDIIVAANVLHATRKLSRTVRHVRSLLRPGGYLVAVEVTGTMLREFGLMGALEGWWLGIEDGRFPSPGISPLQWHDLLRRTGFSGVDTILYDFPDIAKHNCSTFVSRAVDDDFELLLDPLSSVDLVPKTLVHIIGGQSLSLSRAVQQAEKLLRSCGSHITTSTDFEALDPAKTPPGSSVLCLLELDQPAFSNKMAASTLENLQRLLGNAKNVLWATSGRLAENPWSNMMVGIGRSLAFELPHVNIQFIDFDHKSPCDIPLLVQYFLRMVLLCSPKYVDYTALWIQEPELVVSRDSILIPRLVRDHESNENLNTNRRRITKLLTGRDNIMVDYGSKGLILTNHSISRSTQNTCKVEVYLSTPLYVNGKQSCFLSYGKSTTTGKLVLATTESDSGLVFVPPDQLFELPGFLKLDSRHVLALAAVLMAYSVLRQCPKNGVVLVHQPSTSIIHAFEKVATLIQRQVVFTARQINKTPNWIELHDLDSTNSIRKSLPPSTAIFWCSDRVPQNIVASLPAGCAIRVPGDDKIALDGPMGELVNASMQLATNLTPNIMGINSLSIAEVLAHPFTLVQDWRTSEPVEVTMSGIEAKQLFSAQKTYLLIGMTGELGQSICRFMVDSGAHHIVMASRNPTTDKGWLKDISASGVHIQIEQIDVTDQHQVQKLVIKIRASMPSLGGIMNAALVLEDSLFTNTSIESIQRQLGPKVHGTSYLDDCSGDGLDFFIAFSSLGTVYGNAGQSIYHAANMFISSLIEKRRRRGQTGSVINVGMVIDVGYVAKRVRDGMDLDQHLRAQFYEPLSEADLHHLIAQAILCGHPQSGNGELTMGIQQHIDKSKSVVGIPWYNTPRFGHIIKPPALDTTSPCRKDRSAQLRDALQQSSSIDEICKAVQEMVCHKLELLTRARADTIDLKAPLADLGLDSLLAVEIRTWLMRELEVDIPMFQILSRHPISTLVDMIATKYASSRDSRNADAATSVPVVEVSNEAPKMPNSCIRMASRDNNLDGQGAHRALSPEDTVSILPIGPNTHSDSSASSYTEQTDIDEQTPSSETSDLLQTILCQDNLDKSISSVEYGNIERASSSQASLHFLHYFLDDPTTFNVGARYHIAGRLNIQRLSHALSCVLEHHEAYRTCFSTPPGSVELMQGVISEINNSHLTHRQSTTLGDVDEALQALVKREWNLADGNLFDAILFTHTNESHTFLFGCHHIIMDGMSWDIFLRDLERAYQLQPLDMTAKTCRDFSRQQIEYLECPERQRSLEFWINALRPTPAVLPLLPIALRSHRSSLRVYRNHVARTEIKPVTADKIRAIAQFHGASRMQFCLTVVVALFTRILSLEEICVGVTHTGRGGDFNNTIGHFVNLLPMRFATHKSQSFAGILNHVSEVVFNSLEHSKIPIDLILQKLGNHRTPTDTPLFQVAFNYRVGDLLHRRLGNCTLDLVDYMDAKLPYDFTFNATETGKGGILLELVSSQYLYSKDATIMVLHMYERLLDIFCDDPSTLLRESKPYAHMQVQEAISLGQGKITKSPWSETITERFRQVCIAYPSSVAVQDEEGQLTYHQLAVRVCSIAQALRSAGVCPSKCVAVLCEPSVDTWAAMLGVMFTGATYFPVDTSLPVQRQLAMFEIAKPLLLLFHSHTSLALAEYKSMPHISTLDLARIPTASESLPVTFASGKLLLFTSGSTGKPKGILLNQSGIMNYAAAKKQQLELGQIRVLQQSSVSFDMSIAQAFNAFANAGTLIVVPKQLRGDPLSIAQLMVDHSIEFTIATPSEYLMLTAYASDTLRRCSRWKYMCSGGESITDALLYALGRLELPNPIFINCYGPTEVSCATTLQITPLNMVLNSKTIGRPIENTSIYILDRAGTALPVGLPGEICVSGLGLAQYLDADLNKAKFVHNPYATTEDVRRGFTTIYKTGDGGCLRDDGLLVYLGRLDNHGLIKLRGQRIELDEVNNAIRSFGQGKFCDVAVTVRGQPEFLVAHVVYAAGGYMNQWELDKLRSELPLPRYMIPSVVIPIERLPTTASGKVDHNAVAELPLPEYVPDDQTSVLTVPEGEVRIIWKEMLGSEAGRVTIRPNTDFFSVGGNSLLLVRLQHTLKEKLAVQVPLQQLYQASSLQNMAALVSEERSSLPLQPVHWEVETAIPPRMLASLGETVIKRRDENCQVLLTGALGFLGSEVLAVLLADSRITKVHCIAIPEGFSQQIMHHEKVVIYSGSLTSPTLGLSRREIGLLGGNVDRIIHAGAQGHCLNSYQSVRDANCGSTQFLAELALPRRAPFHFISSGRVILQSGAYSTPSKSMAMHPPSSNGFEGFTASKWASECFLERLSHQTGLPVVIHRPCSLVGDRAPHDDAMNSVIRFSMLNRMVPDVPSAKGFFDFKQATEVAAEIAHATTTDKGIVFCHHSSGVKVPFSQLAERMEALYGGKFQTVSMPKWLSKANEQGIEDVIISYLEANFAANTELKFPFLGEL